MLSESYISSLQVIKILLHRYPKRIMTLWIADDSPAHPMVELAHQQQVVVKYRSMSDWIGVADGSVKCVAHCYPAPIRAEQELPALLAKVDTPLVLLLDRITDPQNLGAILRTAYGMGVTAVILPKHHSVKLTDTVRHVSCGGADLVDVFVVTNLGHTIEQLKTWGFWVYGAAATANSILWRVSLPNKVAFVLGAEDKGLRVRTRKLCDQLIHIPIAPGIDSFNVSVATGMFLYECQRQRGNH